MSEKSGSLAEQINLGGKKEESPKKNIKGLPKPFPEDAPLDMQVDFWRKYGDKFKKAGIKISNQEKIESIIKRQDKSGKSVRGIIGKASELLGFGSD